MAQATPSPPFIELINISIINGCVEGTSVSYCIDEKVWQLKKRFNALLVAYDRCKLSAQAYRSRVIEMG